MDDLCEMGRRDGGGGLETCGDLGGGTDSESLISPSSLVWSSSSSIGTGAGGAGGLAGTAVENEVELVVVEGLAVEVAGWSALP